MKPSYNDFTDTLKDVYIGTSLPLLIDNTPTNIHAVSLLELDLAMEHMRKGRYADKYALPLTFQFCSGFGFQTRAGWHI